MKFVIVYFNTDEGPKSGILKVVGPFNTTRQAALRQAPQSVIMPLDPPRA